MKTTNTETVWCRVTTMTGSLLVGVCYHSTSVKKLSIIMWKLLLYTKPLPFLSFKAATEANAILGMINRGFNYKTKEVVFKLYKSLVRPHLDYCISVFKLGVHINKRT